MFVECFDELCEVGKRAGETVDLVDNDNVDLASPDLVQQILQGRAIQRSAGQAAVVESIPDQSPAFMRLALDIGLTGLPLGVKRVEGQIQIVLGRLARVDRAALAFGSDCLHGPPPRSLNVACTLERRPDRPEALRDEDGWGLRSRSTEARS